jgi:hypothetical protein
MTTGDPTKRTQDGVSRHTEEPKVRRENLEVSRVGEETASGPRIYPDEGMCVAVDGTTGALLQHAAGP